MLQGSLESVDSCKVCGSIDEEEEAGCGDSIAANGSTSCSCQDNTKQGKNTHKLRLTFSSSQVGDLKCRTQNTSSHSFSDALVLVFMGVIGLSY